MDTKEICQCGHYTGHHGTSIIGPRVCNECDCAYFRPAPQGTPEVNYMQVLPGGHCYLCHKTYTAREHYCEYREMGDVEPTACHDKCPQDARDNNPKNKKDLKPISAQIEEDKLNPPDNTTIERDEIEQEIAIRLWYALGDVETRDPKIIRAVASIKELISTAHRNGYDEGFDDSAAIEETRKDVEKEFERSPEKIAKEWTQKGFIEGAESMKAKAVEVVEKISIYEESGAGKHHAEHIKPPEMIKQEILEALDALNKLTP